MKLVAKAFVTAVLVGLLLPSTPRAGQEVSASACPLIEQALRDYEQVKNATTRREIARFFVPDGGMQFPARTRYVYPKCDYLHVDIEFELVKPSGASSLPDDKVIGVSKLYMEYPAKD